MCFLSRLSGGGGYSILREEAAESGFYFTLVFPAYLCLVTSWRWATPTWSLSGHGLAMHTASCYLCSCRWYSDPLQEYYPHLWIRAVPPAIPAGAGAGDRALTPHCFVPRVPSPPSSPATLARSSCWPGYLQCLHSFYRAPVQHLLSIAGLYSRPRPTHHHHAESNLDAPAL